MIRNGLLVVAVALGLVFLVEFALMALNPPSSAGAPRHAYTVAWFLWMLLSLAGFMAIEGAALIDSEEGDTLTEHIQWISGQSTGWAVAVMVGIASFFGWFMAHLFGRDSRVWAYLEAKRAARLAAHPEEVPDADD